MQIGALGKNRMGRRCLWGFGLKSSRRLPVITLPLNNSYYHCYWALLESEASSVGHEVILCPQIPILTWVQGTPVSQRIGHAQEASIIKWKWYIQDRMKPGPKGQALLHEQVFDPTLPGSLEITKENPQEQESPIHGDCLFSN